MLSLHRRGLLEAAVAGLLSQPALAFAAAQEAGVQTAQAGAWQDSRRQRSLPWLLRLPASAGPWPWVVYSHGLGGSREGGAAWGQAWAAAGIAVLHLQHPGSDIETLRRGLAALRAGASAEQLLARVADVRFAIDEVARAATAGAMPWAALRADALGVAGHSFGAHTTQAVAGQRYAVAGDLSDPRPRAFIAFSPSSPAGGRPPLQQAFGAITRPFMAVTGSLDGDPFGSFATGEPRAAVYQGLPPGQRALLWLEGADHMTFGGGRPAGVGTRGLVRRQAITEQREPAHHALVARLGTQWWQAQLLGDTAARTALAHPQGLGAGDRFTLG